MATEQCKGHWMAEGVILSQGTGPPDADFSVTCVGCTQLGHGCPSVVWKMAANQRFHGGDGWYERV